MNLAKEATKAFFKDSWRGNELRIMTDGIKVYDDQPVGSDYGAVMYRESYTRVSKDEDFWGLGFDEYKSYDKVVYTSGPTFVNGGWFTEGLKVQTRQLGEWKDVSGLVIEPLYPYDNTAGNPLKGAESITGIDYTFSFDDTWGDGIRIVGKPYTDDDGVSFTSISEFEVYYVAE